MKIKQNKNIPLKIQNRYHTQKFKLISITLKSFKKVAQHTGNQYKS
jgi:hypothetical protein